MTTQTIDLEALHAAVRGRVITAADPDYDEARAVFYNVTDARPAAVVRVADAADVSAVVRFASANGLELAVRCGGHSGAGYGTCDGGITIDLQDLNGIELDPASRTVWAGGGLTASELSTRLAEDGLVIGFGDTGTVGIGGLTTGGGIGYLVRKYGLTIDNVLAAEVVTADGQVHVADATSEPDLFWAIRGGGGNFGVVTRFRFQLHELRQVVGGMLLLPATADSVAGFVRLAEAAPDELSTIANVMPAPPLPFVPETWHGKLVIMALMAYAGDPADAERVLAPFRGLAEPIADMLRPIPYPEMFPPADPDYHPAAAGRTLFVERVDEALAGRILDRLQTHLQETNAMMAVAQFRPLGGAAARVPADATAYGFRDKPIMVSVASIVPTIEDLPAHEPWVQAFAEELRGDDPSAYVNFINAEGPERVRDAYPTVTWDRLVAVKQRYDPTNLFHRNQNIPPNAG
jgi:FAD/FMN-containing dehydrogenase